ncbi:MAG: hypothetical protein H6626_06960 [Pseudobdellovibrionaceae bacterium]|nr:hypothetical protein [Bdellovibrionales bacterium]USN48822.1 MAG: hypothetical protein H6626_06960 [Pseudobdellovibrionaceae bacterium]
MDTGQVVHFIDSSHETAILVSVIGLLLVAAYYIFQRYFKSSDEPDLNTRAGLIELEQTLRKVLSQTKQRPTMAAPEAQAGDAVAAQSQAEGSVAAADAGEGVAPAAASSGLTAEQVAEAQKQVTELKAELKKRDEEIKSLHDSVDKKVAEERTVLMTKLHDLESKLLEYEIIEDDIADLSRYKEENARLKAELENLGAGSGEKPAPPRTAEPDSEVVDEAEDDIVAEKPQPASLAQDEVDDLFASAIAEADQSIDGVDEVDTDDDDEEAAPSADDDQLVSEFQQAVSGAGDDDEDLSDEGDPADLLRAIMEGDEKISGDAGGKDQDGRASDDDDAVQDDILAEFTSEDDDDTEALTRAVMEEIEGAVTAKAPAMEEKVAAPAIDTDKMLSEVAGLAEEPLDDAGNALEEDFDVDKMAAEATKLVSD